VKYALIRRNQRAWPIRVQCRMLGVRVAGLPRTRCSALANRPASSPGVRQGTGGAYPCCIFGKSRSLWLAPHLARTACSGHSCGETAGQRLMQEHGIRARGKRRFRVTTTDSRHGLADRARPTCSKSKLSPWPRPTRRGRATSPTVRPANVARLYGGALLEHGLECSAR